MYEAINQVVIKWVPVYGLQDRLPNKGINRRNASERHAFDVSDYRLHF
jgi:hypothetical protein